MIIQQTKGFKKCPVGLSMNIMLASSPGYILLMGERVIQVAVMTTNAAVHFTDGSIRGIAAL